jgi:hypothetical protein
LAAICFANSNSSYPHLPPLFLPRSQYEVEEEALGEGGTESESPATGTATCATSPSCVLAYSSLLESESPSFSTLAVGLLFTLSCVLPHNFTNTDLTTTNHSAEGQSYSNYGGGGDLLDLMDDEPASMSTPMSHSAPGDIYHCLALIRERCFAETVLYPPSLHLLPLAPLLTASTGPKKVQLVTSEVGHGVFISGVMTKVNGQLALVMDIGNYLNPHLISISYLT